MDGLHPTVTASLDFKNYRMGILSKSKSGIPEENEDE